MIRRLLRRLTTPPDPEPPSVSPRSIRLIPPDLPLPYSWVLTGRLALGPMPASASHWQQLEQAGLRARFSCCYPQELGPVPPPPHWHSDGVPLPDHRRQETLTQQRLVEAVVRAERLLQTGDPVYLHCMAGIERSPLLAVALTARQRDLSLFEALDWVRRCHPPALPIASQLALLEQLLPPRV
jgi:hypothetical protein